ncbi:MAG: hypothetical protein AB7K86_24295 [Rhodospirillales bacterium]
MKPCAVWFLALALAAPAWAYMPPQAYIKMRAAAELHVQVRVGTVAAAAEAFGDCPVTGTVVRIFRDAAKALRPEQAIAFGVPCQVRRDAPVQVGGTAWHDLGRLREAKVIEAFLNRRDGRYRIADHGDGVRLLDAPTATPRVTDQR